MTLRAVALNCTLKGGDDPSSTAVLVEEVLAELADQGVEGGEIVRVVDHDVRPGVTSDGGAPFPGG